MSTDNPYDTPLHASASTTAQRRQLTLKRIDVFSAAIMLGSLYLFIGLIAGAVVAVLSIIGMAANAGGGVRALTGVGAIIALPLFYGVLGFIGGAIGAVIYNVAAGFAGGIKMEVE